MWQNWLRRFREVSILAAVSVVVAEGAWGAEPVQKSAVQAPVWQSIAADGQAYQAIVLKAETLVDAVAPKVHGILVDTSASQVGEHRRYALRVVASFLESLPADHSVRLYAMDVKAEPLTTVAVGPRSPEAQAAFAALEKRVPLGATNLLSALERVRQDLPPGIPGSIVLIGDGQSAAAPVDAQAFEQLVTTHRDAQLPISSLGVGPAVNSRMLGALALQTGGMMLNDRASRGDDDTSAKGRSLAKAAIGRVQFPSSVKVTPSSVVLLPSAALPLREDRETVYLSHGVLPADAQLVLSRGATQNAWTLSDPTEKAGMAFLAEYGRQLVLDQGLSNGLAGAQTFPLMQDDFQSLLNGMLQQGQLALAKHQPEQAALIAERVRQFDPGLIEAKALIAAAEQMQVQLVSKKQETPRPSAQTTIDEAERLSRVKTQKFQYEVSRVIEAARAVSEVSAAIDELKRTINSVRAAVDINPEERTRLLKQLQAELERSQIRLERKAQEETRQRERLAEVESRQRLADTVVLEEERLQNLIDRVRALMLEGRHGDSPAFGEAEAVAQVAVNARPGEGTAAAARFNAEAANQLDRSFQLRAKRADQFLETLHLVETSHIPFPDEPPIRFPSAEVWNALTQRRKKYKAVDLRNDGPSERRLEAALDEKTEVSFADTALSDAIDFLKDYHQIPILVDTAALQDEGIDASSPVSLALSGITLRSALRIMLEPLGLTYAIQDEVMKITTSAKADEALSTRVYPVADLVVPIISMGGGMMGGGMMGGGMGGMGGGMGGMGGGMGGMGGGMGGGFPSVPPEALAPLPQPSLKKKQPLN